MAEFIIIRPGATIYDVERRVQGALSVPMNVLGRNQVDLLVDKLRDQGLKTLYSPASEPCRETAEILGRELNIPVVTLENLENWNMGLWQGMDIEEQLRKCQPTVYKMGREDPWNLRPPEGEPLEEVMKRVEAAYRKFGRKSQDKVGIVVQEPLGGLIRQYLTGDTTPEIDIWKTNHLPGSLESVQIEP